MMYLTVGVCWCCQPRKALQLVGKRMVDEQPAVVARALRPTWVRSYITYIIQQDIRVMYIRVM